MSACEPGETYYVMWGWSGCAGSAWSTLTQATKDGWRHAEEAQDRAIALSRQIDRCAEHLRMALGYKPGQPDAGLESLSVQVKHAALTKDPT